MSRKRFNEREVIETLAHQGVWVTCFRCRNPFFGTLAGIVYQLLNIEREHLHEIKLGGPDVPYNCRYSCKPCHDKITNGTKATTAGSSKQRIAKVARLLSPRKSKRPMQKPQRKLASRPFQKRLVRKS